MVFKKLFLGEYLLDLLSVCSSSNFEVTSVESSYGRGLSGTFLSILEVASVCATVHSIIILFRVI